jgi:acyl-CoA synthetase (AMP-forming)/AMP-acid ligase II
MRCVDIVRGDDGTTQQPKQLGPALLSYQKNRRPEHAALIRLARFGSPYQYKQPWLRHRIGSMLWTANVIFRLLLNKVSLGRIPPAAIMIMATNHSFTFRQIMRRADLTACSLQFLMLSCFIRMALMRWKSSLLLLSNVGMVETLVVSLAVCIAGKIVECSFPILN